MQPTVGETTGERGSRDRRRPGRSAQRSPGSLRPSLRRADFERVTRGTRRISTQYFLVFILLRTDPPPPAAAGSSVREASEPSAQAGPRLGITVTRKVGNAVRRNRIKRLLREWFRRARTGLGAVDVVVIAKRGIPTALSLTDVVSDMGRAVSTPRVRRAQPR